MPRGVLLAVFGIVIGGGLLAPAVSFPAEDESFEGLAPGPGREAVYYTCRACHSVKQFTQQQLGRDDWDITVTRMVRKNGMAEPEPWARTLMVNYLSTHFGVDQEDWAGLPPGAGREEVFYLCQACHSLKTVLQQRLDRDSWDETLTWMVEEQGMPEPEPDERRTILEYLGTYLSPEAPS